MATAVAPWGKEVPYNVPAMPRSNWQPWPGQLPLSEEVLFLRFYLEAPHHVELGDGVEDVDGHVDDVGDDVRDGDGRPLNVPEESSTRLKYKEMTGMFAVRKNTQT